MDLVVPDASVILKWALPSDEERDADRALALRDAITNDHVRALVPSLWLYEVGNTIARRFPDDAGSWLAALLRFGLQEAPVTSQWLTAVVELTGRYGVSFHDAAYHATAIVHGGVFVTADERYARIAASHGAIVTLDEWGPGNGGPGNRKR
jgi:predicted nucleic acid-binding protein